MITHFIYNRNFKLLTTIVCLFFFINTITADRAFALQVPLNTARPGFANAWISVTSVITADQVVSAVGEVITKLEIQNLDELDTRMIRTFFAYLPEIRELSIMTTDQLRGLFINPVFFTDELRDLGLTSGDFNIRRSSDGKIRDIFITLLDGAGVLRFTSPDPSDQDIPEGYRMNPYGEKSKTVGNVGIQLLVKEEHYNVLLEHVKSLPGKIQVVDIPSTLELPLEEAAQEIVYEFPAPELMPDVSEVPDDRFTGTLFKYYAPIISGFLKFALVGLALFTVSYLSPENSDTGTVLASFSIFGVPVEWARSLWDRITRRPGKKISRTGKIRTVEPLEERSLFSGSPLGVDFQGLDQDLSGDQNSAYVGEPVPGINVFTVSEQATIDDFFARFGEETPLMAMGGEGEGEAEIEDTITYYSDTGYLESVRYAVPQDGVVYQEHLNEPFYGEGTKESPYYGRTSVLVLAATGEDGVIATTTEYEGGSDKARTETGYSDAGMANHIVTYVFNAEGIMTGSDSVVTGDKSTYHGDTGYLATIEYGTPKDGILIQEHLNEPFYGTGTEIDPYYGRTSAMVLAEADRDGVIAKEVEYVGASDKERTVRGYSDTGMDNHIATYNYNSDGVTTLIANNLESGYYAYSWTNGYDQVTVHSYNGQYDPGRGLVSRDLKESGAFITNQVVSNMDIATNGWISMWKEQYQYFGNFDPNMDGVISAGDVLYVINFINRNGAQLVTEEIVSMDVNGDGNITPADVLVMINYINANGTKELYYGMLVSARYNYDDQGRLKEIVFSRPAADGARSYSIVYSGQGMARRIYGYSDEGFRSLIVDYTYNFGDILIRKLEYRSGGHVETSYYDTGRLKSVVYSGVVSPDGIAEKTHKDEAFYDNGTPDDVRDDYGRLTGLKYASAPPGGIITESIVYSGIGDQARTVYRYTAGNWTQLKEELEYNENGTLVRKKVYTTAGMTMYSEYRYFADTGRQSYARNLDGAETWHYNEAFYNNSTPLDTSDDYGRIYRTSDPATGKTFTYPAYFSGSDRAAWVIEEGPFSSSRYYFPDGSYRYVGGGAVLDIKRNELTWKNDASGTYFYDWSSLKVFKKENSGAWFSYPIFNSPDRTNPVVGWSQWQNWYPSYSEESSLQSLRLGDWPGGSMILDYPSIPSQTGEGEAQVLPANAGTSSMPGMPSADVGTAIIVAAGAMVQAAITVPETVEEEMAPDPEKLPDISPDGKPRGVRISEIVAILRAAAGIIESREQEPTDTTEAFGKYVFDENDPLVKMLREDKKEILARVCVEDMIALEEMKDSDGSGMSTPEISDWLRVLNGFEGFYLELYSRDDFLSRADRSVYERFGLLSAADKIASVDLGRIKRSRNAVVNVVSHNVFEKLDFNLPEVNRSIVMPTGEIQQDPTGMVRGLFFGLRLAAIGDRTSDAESQASEISSSFNGWLRALGYSGPDVLNPQDVGYFIRQRDPMQYMALIKRILEALDKITPVDVNGLREVYKAAREVAASL